MSRKDRIKAIRGFNRFYTQQIGVVTEGLLQSRFSLAEVRVLFEIAHHRAETAADLVDALRIDPGYVSRILRKFERSGLIRRRRSREDGRQRTLELTPRGQKAFSGLDRRANLEIESILDRLTDVQIDRLVGGMREVQSVLTTSAPATPYVLRPHGPGDVGYVTYRHGVLFGTEFGFSSEFEAHIGATLSAMAARANATRERLWIADLDGHRLGSAAIVRESDQVARLMALLVEPPDRSRGIGRRLVTECLRYAAGRGYTRLEVEVQSVLKRARSLLESLDFHVTQRRRVRQWGRTLQAETWVRALSGERTAGHRA